MRLFSHYRDAAPGWRWPHFTPREVACKGTGELLVNPTALDALERLRVAWGRPIVLTSAYRSPRHNRAVGGARASKHLDGAAFDIPVTAADAPLLERIARAAGFLGFGFYPRSGFMHVDLGPAREWGDRFPTVAAPAVRASLSESRTIKGGAVAGGATVAGAAVEAARDVLVETQGALAPAGLTLDVLQYALVAVALAGIALTIWARVDDWRQGRR